MYQWFFKACVLYILRVGMVDQMTEPTQRSFLVILGKQVCWIKVRAIDECQWCISVSFSIYASVISGILQLQSPDSSAPMKVAALRTLSYTLKTLEEVNLAVTSTLIFLLVIWLMIKWFFWHTYLWVYLWTIFEGIKRVSEAWLRLQLALYKQEHVLFGLDRHCRIEKERRKISWSEDLGKVTVEMIEQRDNN